MYALGSLSLFLVIAVFSSVCTIGNSVFESTQCQDKVMKLKCVNKSYVLSILSVFYGRDKPGSQTCRTPIGSILSDESRCYTNVTSQVKKICGWKNSCTFVVNKEALGNNECLNVFKFLYVRYKCDLSVKVKRKVVKLVSPTPLVVMATSTVTSSSRAMASEVLTTEAIRPTSTLVANVERLSTIYQSEEATTTLRSSSLSSSRPHRVSVTTVSHTQRLSAATSVAIENPSLKTTKPASKTYEKSATLTDQHGTMKLFKFIISFHIIREEHIHKRTASSVVWFMFGLLVGLFIMIAILVYYRVKRARRERQNKPNKAAYFKQKDCSDGTIEEKVILHPKELEALEMESQLGETV